MSYRRPGSRSRLQAGSATASYMRNAGRNYSRPAQTGGLRHEGSFDVPQVGTPEMLALGEYFVVENALFMRSSAAGTPDLPFTPSASNNLASPRVMNGSYISNFSSNIRLKNQDSVDTVTLDVYEITLSFYDCLIWESILPDACPFTFSQTANIEGQVAAKVGLVPDFTVQNINNFKFLQHFARHMGSVTIGDVQGDNVIELKQHRIPPKCRRSNTGMYWGLVFVYDSTKNKQQNATIEFNQELSFRESTNSDRIVNFPE